MRDHAVLEVTARRLARQPGGHPQNPLTVMRGEQPEIALDAPRKTVSRWPWPLENGACYRVVWRRRAATSPVSSRRAGEREPTMDRPDTIIELHRERVQAQAAGVYAGGTYQRLYNGSYTERGTATLTLALDRVWFVFDAHPRLWQEETGSGAHDPVRHFAMDLVLKDSRIVIESVGGIPLVPLPPTTVTIPNGPRAGEQREIAYNELPLLGRLTLHEQLEARPTEPGKQTISLDFNTQHAPVLVAGVPPDQFAHLFGTDSVARTGAPRSPARTPG
jgi:hypothetical protein